jgi:hypothetical protein
MLFATVFAFVLRSLIASAQPAAESDAKAEAVAHFEKGLALYDTGAWSAALAEFLEARRLYSLRNVGYQAALCLEKLQRYDEALDQLEGVLRSFGEELPPAARETVQRKVVEMRGHVGEIVVGNTESGATVSVDGLARGESPLPAPLRIVEGSHVVKVFKAGFEPFEVRVSVVGGKTERVVAPLISLRREPAREPPFAPEPRAPRASPSGVPAWVWVTGSFGVAFEGAAIGFGVDGLNALSRLKNGCASSNPDVCTPMPPGSYSPDTDNARKNRDLALAIGFGAAGVAGIGTAIAVVARSRGSSRRANGVRASRAPLLPIVGASVRGAVVSGSW